MFNFSVVWFILKHFFNVKLKINLQKAWKGGKFHSNKIQKIIRNILKKNFNVKI